ncbi:hypothetical protein [Paenibacillus sp. EKM211P]|uniref:hypothetical protein n=1 Tax=Paenibacillus sp. EKM211P TaxID=1683679 RepID=UPI0013E90E71|nr:hypothetical protein [Paenibacillus sp. EKM211P]KAF6583751.1 hypothetical protein G9G57_12240 [Paenibacillus sp. EKM211P]
MTEAIEFYVSLLDDKISNEILSDFKEVVPGFTKQAPLKLKRNYIIQIFKRQTPKTRKKTIDPFFYHINNRHQLSDLSSVTSNEEFLARVSSENIPDYLKVALTLKYDMKLFEEIMPVLKKRLDNNECLFDFTYEVKDEEEATKKLRQDLYLDEEQKDNLFKIAISLLPDEQIKKNKAELDKVGGMSLTDFYTSYWKSQDDGILSLAYAVENEQLDYSLKYGLVTDFIYKCAKKGQKEVDKLEKMKSYKVKVEELEDSVSVLKEKLKITEERNKEITITKKQVLSLQEQVNKVQFTVAEKETEIERLNSLGNSKLEEQKLLYDSKLQKKDQEILELQRKLDSWKVEPTEKINDFCVIYESSDVSLVQSLFPEIIFVASKEWSKQRGDLVKNGLTRIYIQQNGISSKRLFAIQEKAGLHYSTFIMHDHKSLIELISLWKRGENPNV